MALKKPNFAQALDFIKEKPFFLVGAFALPLAFTWGIATQSKASELNQKKNDLSMLETKLSETQRTLENQQIQHSSSSVISEAVREFSTEAAEVAMKNSCTLVKVNAGSMITSLTDATTLPADQELSSWGAIEVQLTWIGTAPQLYKALDDLRESKMVYEIKAIKMSENNINPTKESTTTAELTAIVYSKTE